MSPDVQPPKRHRTALTSAAVQLVAERSTIAPLNWFVVSLNVRAGAAVVPWIAVTAPAELRTIAGGEVRRRGRGRVRHNRPDGVRHARLGGRGGGDLSVGADVRGRAARGCR